MNKTVKTVKKTSTKRMSIKKATPKVAVKKAAVRKPTAKKAVAKPTAKKAVAKKAAPKRENKTAGYSFVEKNIYKVGKSYLVRVSKDLNCTVGKLSEAKKRRAEFWKQKATA